MKVGFVGLGKLGLPMALVAERAGHEVRGWDAVETTRTAVAARKVVTHETGVAELLAESRVELALVDELAAWADLLVVVVQTPHLPEFEGVTVLGDDRADFDYSHLVAACEEIGATGATLPVAVVSTVLPGTMHDLVIPALGSARLVYNPSLIAMGTAVEDYTHPEMVICGVDDPVAAETLRSFYKPIHDRPVLETDVRSAELIKVAYNVFIGLKLAFANTMAQICDRTGADVDEVTRAMGMATDRIVSTRYMRAGMGDGGGCHPRSQIALSWLAGELGLRHDLFADIIRSREAHTRWLADRARAHADRTELPIVILGKAYKANSPLTIGSAAVLLAGLLPEATAWDPLVDPGPRPDHAAVYLVAAAHDTFRGMEFPAGSVVVDPWGIIESADTLDTPGRPRR